MCFIENESVFHTCKPGTWTYIHTRASKRVMSNKNVHRTLKVSFSFDFSISTLLKFLFEKFLNCVILCLPINQSIVSRWIYLHILLYSFYESHGSVKFPLRIWNIFFIFTLNECLTINCHYFNLIITDREAKMKTCAALIIDSLR